MTDLKIRALGDLQVIRDGESLDLPPSKKTRGLLAYLALHDRSFRREQLCELLWEIPDDPRGSLRWSLSKIRKLVDDEQHMRIVADRATVTFDSRDVEIDVRQLQALANGDSENVATTELEKAADDFQGSFLAGLDLPNFHEFYTWCIGQREQVSQSQAQLLKLLITRFHDKPDVACNYASRLVSVTPYEAQPRATLISLLVGLGRKQEAEQQYRVGKRMLAEIGAEDTGILYQAWRGTPASGRTKSPVARAEVALSQIDRDLIGRNEELRLIDSLLAEVKRTNSAKMLLVRGDPGIGKSRIVRSAALLARKSGTGILKAETFESDLVRPFSVWNDALRRSMPGNPVSSLLGSSDRISRDQIFESLAALICDETRDRTLVILFDDLHWCDESSTSALHYLLRVCQNRPILIIAASREHELQLNHAALQAIRGVRNDNLLIDMHLEPLSAPALKQIISEHAPDIDATKLSQECGGNPLFAIELARAEAQGGTASSLTDLLRERMLHATKDTITLLQWAAVLNPRINVNSLHQVTGLDKESIDVAFETSEQLGILHPGQRGFRFSHDLIAKAVYDDLSPTRKQAMHRKIAELLEVDTALDLALAAELAHHAPKSGDPLLAARAMISAGRLCVRFYANDDALALYQRGLAYADKLDDQDRIRLLLDLGDIHLSAAPFEDWETATEKYINLAEQALDHGDLTYARLGYQIASYLRWLHGDWADAQRNSLQAQRVAKGGTEEQQIIGTAEAAKCLALLERDLSQADAMVMEAQALANRRAFTCTAIPVCLGILRYYENRFDTAIDHLEDARTLCKTRGERLSEYMANEYLALIEIERGDYGAALNRVKSLIEIGGRLREGSELPYAKALEALCQYGLTGDDANLEGTIADVRGADAKQRLAFLLNRAAILDIQQNNLGTAIDRAEEALSLATLMEKPSEITQAHTSLLEIRCKSGENQMATHVSALKELTKAPLAKWVLERARTQLDVLSKQGPRGE